MANPNPARITGPVWRMWEEGSRIIPGVRLGGIFAAKDGYHDTRDGNPSWNYSVTLPLDRQGPGDKAGAIDFTMSDHEMRLRTGYLKQACLHPDDDRVNAMREFYGTLDSRNVYGLIQDQPGGPWQASSSDSSHLWHIHISIFRAYVDRWDMLAPIISVLSGETWEQWQARKGTGTTPGGNMDGANDYGSYGKPDSLGGRPIAVMIADNWGQEHSESSPWVAGTQSARTARLIRTEENTQTILAKLAQLELPTVELPDDLADKIAEGLADAVAEKVLEKIRAEWND